MQIALNLDKYLELADWVKGLQGMDDSSWSTPLQEGKWSVREIIAHLLFWDRKVRDEMLPDMVEGADLKFENIQQVNDAAAAYAQTVDRQELIEELVQTRSKLAEAFTEKFDPELRFKLEGHLVGFQGFLDDFVGHDKHHRKQVDEWLAAR